MNIDKSKSQDRKTVVVLGAGPAGLGAAYHLAQLGYAVSIIDRAHYLGGASASFRIKDYIVDYGPHAFHIKREDIVKMTKALIGDDYVEVKRQSRLIMDGKNLRYPLNIKEALLKISPVLTFKVLADYLLARLHSGSFNNNHKPVTFEDWGTNAFGHTLYRLAFGNYSEKMWGLPGNQLSGRLAQQKLLKLDLWKLILQVLGISDTTFEGGVTEYYDMYPRFGIGTIFNRMADEITKRNGNNLYLDSQVIDIKTRGQEACTIRFLHSGSEKELSFDYLVSTIPLKYLSQYLMTPQRNQALSFSDKLKYRDIRIVYVILDRDYYSQVHWFYLLDPHFKFNRLSEQKNLNKESSPAGKTVISLDISCNFGDEIWNMADEELFELAVSDLSHIGITQEHVVDYFTLSLRDVYPVYDLGFEKQVEGLIKIFSQYPNVYSVGRQGIFLNNDIHDSLEMGMLVADFINTKKSSRLWYDYILKYVGEKLEGGRK